MLDVLKPDLSPTENICIRCLETAVKRRGDATQPANS